MRGGGVDCRGSVRDTNGGGLDGLGECRLDRSGTMVLNYAQASFLILIGSFLSPPSDPFVAVLERELLIILFVCLAWA